MEASSFFDIGHGAAAGMLSRMISIIDEQWRAHCRAVGMTAEEIKRYEPAFDHEESRIARRLTGSSRV